MRTQALRLPRGRALFFGGQLAAVLPLHRGQNSRKRAATAVTRVAVRVQEEPPVSET